MKLKKTINNIIILIWSVLVFTQQIYSIDEAEVLTGVLALVGGWFGVSVFFRSYLLISYPISTSMMIGYIAYYFLFPPVVTFLEGKPLNYNINHPVLVYTHALLCLFVLSFSHFLYRKSQFVIGLRLFVSERIYRSFGFFNPPSNFQLFAMGGIGLLALLMQISIYGAEQNDAVGAGNKFIQALFPLAYLPFCALIPSIMGSSRLVEKKWKISCVIYMVVMFFLAMTKNSRSVLFMGLASITLSYFYGLTTGLCSLKVINKKTVSISTVLLVLFAGPFADIATSMQVVRAHRAQITSIELINETFNAFSNKQVIEEYRNKKRTLRTDWDEEYIDSPFWSRLANLKFADQGLDLAISLDASRSSGLRSLEGQKALSVLPRPVLDLFDMNVDKDMVGSASGGDILLYSATGNASVLGGFRTGSIFASGYGMFGWLYIPILGVCGVFVFLLADAQTSRVFKSVNHGPKQIAPVFSAMTAATYFGWIFYFTSAASGIEAMSAFSQLIFRGWLQSFFIYIFALSSVSIVPKLIFRQSYRRFI